ncbi:unnamed protein product [Lampetra planeri]
MLQVQFEGAEAPCSTEGPERRRRETNSPPVGFAEEPSSSGSPRDAAKAKHVNVPGTAVDNFSGKVATEDVKVVQGPGDIAAAPRRGQGMAPTLGHATFTRGLPAITTTPQTLFSLSRLPSLRVPATPGHCTLSMAVLLRVTLSRRLPALSPRLFSSTAPSESDAPG